jgi:hypothetical protein
MNSKIFLIIPSYGKNANTQKYIIKVNKKEQINSIVSSNLQGIPPTPPPPTPPPPASVILDREGFIILLAVDK